MLFLSYTLNLLNLLYKIILANYIFHGLLTVHIKFKLLSHKIMEDETSILASPVDSGLLPVGAVGGLLLQQCPELVLVAPM